MAKPEPLSLYHAVSSGGYEASIVATYATSFELYERVVLRRLLASGCRYNILLADAGQCARDVERGPAPQFCGTDYLLLPVRAEGAFHPKFVLLLGKRGARLIVGSHNVTFGGFGFNREIATEIECSSGDKESSAVRAVWRFVRQWTATFPSALRDAVSAVERMAPWLIQSEPAFVPHGLMYSEPSGKSLWQQLLEVVDRPVRRVVVLAPYFDGQLRFIKAIEKDLAPKELLVAVHPSFSEIPTNARQLSPRAKFIDISQLGDGWSERYVHAKSYCIECVNGRTIVITGSANASAPAWGLPGTEPNAELILVHEDGQQLWKRLGLTALTGTPELGKSAWTEIQSRNAAKSTEPVGSKAFWAVSKAGGFLVEPEFIVGVKPAAISVISDEGNVGSIDAIVEGRDGITCAVKDDAVRDSASRLEATPKTGARRFALVQHVDSLLDRATGSVRHAFRVALSGLRGDPEQLTSLLDIVQRAIFDDVVPVDIEMPSASAGKAGKSAEKSTHEEPKTLAVATAATQRARRKRRLQVSSDLALIIDALIYRLGQGLPSRTDTDTAAADRSTDRAAADDDPPPEVDGHLLAKMCRGKIKRLFGRMVRQLELTASTGKEATTSIIQLAAVLGIVKHIQSQQVTFDWLPKHEELVDADDAWEFFKEASRLLYAAPSKIAERARLEHDQQDFDELSTVRSLLTWLAFSTGLDVRTALAPLVEDREHAEENLQGVGYLLPPITECVRDEAAEGLLADIAASDAEVSEQVRYHLDWARGIATSFSAAGPAGDIRLGDIVCPTKIAAQWASVVIESQYGKAGVLDLATGEPKFFSDGYLKRLKRLPSPLAH